MSSTITTSSYSLPLALAFCSGRWGSFWEVLYYLAACNNSTFLRLRLPQFSGLLYGLPPGAPLSNRQAETGRKLFRKFCTEAQAVELLHKVSEAEDLYLNNFGATAEHHLRLALDSSNLQVPLSKPAGFIENGWLRALDHSYTLQLVNLWLLEPPPSSPPNWGQVAARLQSLYHTTPPALRRTASLAGLARQLEAAGRELAGLQLVPHRLAEQFADLPGSPNAIYLTAGLLSEVSVMSAGEQMLVNYQRLNPVRAVLLEKLLESNQIERREYKEVWATLAEWGGTDDFGLLCEALNWRAKVAGQGRFLSWREVVNIAGLLRQRRERRGTKHLFNRLTGWRFEGTATSCQKTFRPAFELAENARGLSRWRFEVWANVAGWRNFRDNPARRPAPATLRLTLYDGEFRPVFETPTLTIDPLEVETAWTFQLESAFSAWRTATPDPELRFMHLEASCDRPATWFSFATRLTYSSRRLQ